MNTKEKIIEIRSTAERLILGEPQARWLRGLVIELCSAMLGEDVKHPDVEMTGARYTPPSFTGSMPAPPVAGLAATAHAVPPPGMPGSPASPLRRPNPAPLTLAEGAALAAARRAQASAPAPAPAEVNGAGDPAGPGYLDDLKRRIDAEDTDSETGT